MNKIKILLVVVLLASVLSFGTPVVTRASENARIPPAVVFVQDKNDKMLVSHNFSSDERIFVPGDNYNDPGFYIKIPVSGKK
jgi:hypothetical protein